MLSGHLKRNDVSLILVDVIIQGDQLCEGFLVIKSCKSKVTDFISYCNLSCFSVGSEERYIEYSC